MEYDIEEKAGPIKCYVFLTDAITSIGGGQIYTSNKKKYLEERGWEVFIFSSIDTGEILVPELEPHKNGIYPILRISPSILRKELIKKTIEKILQSINSIYSEICVECHSTTLALWGELLSKELNAKCFVYLLSENFNCFSSEMLNYFQFKLERKELAGISKNSLSLLFKNQKKLTSDEQYYLRANLGDVVSDVHCDFIDTFTRGDITIGSIGRLNKGYVPVMVDDVVEFAKSNSSKMIQLILVGDTENSLLKAEIQNKVREVSNLSVLVVGSLFPLPKALLDLFDLNIGSAGSARLAAFHGIPTIALDVVDYKPIGILGFETNSTLYREKNYTSSLPEIIQKILGNLEYYNDIQNWKFPIKMNNPSDAYDKHMNFLNSSDQTKDYYNFEYKSLKLNELLKKYLIILIGVSNYTRLTNNTKFMSIYSKAKKWSISLKSR